MHKNGRTFKCPRKLIGFYTIGDHLLFNVLNIPSFQPITKTLHDFSERSVIINIGFF